MIDPITKAAKTFGFAAREVPAGYFIAPVRADGTLGDDTTLIKHSGEIVPYDNHGAQAHLCAQAVTAALATT